MCSFTLVIQEERLHNGKYLILSKTKTKTKNHDWPKGIYPFN
jgi:hypothetical protein